MLPFMQREHPPWELGALLLSAFVGHPKVLAIAGNPPAVAPWTSSLLGGSADMIPQLQFQQRLHLSCRPDQHRTPYFLPLGSARAEDQVGLRVETGEGTGTWPGWPPPSFATCFLYPASWATDNFSFKNEFFNLVFISSVYLNMEIILVKYLTHSLEHRRYLINVIYQYHY